MTERESGACGRRTSEPSRTKRDAELHVDASALTKIAASLEVRGAHVLERFAHFVVMGGLRLTQALGDLDDSPLDAPENARSREAPRRVTLTRGMTREDLDPVGDRIDRIEVELALLYRTRNVVSQDEVAKVWFREQNPLL